MWVIGYAIFGLVAGAIARFLHPGKDPMNWVWTMLLGIAGAEVGGFGARQLGFDPTTSKVVSWVAAVVGAILLLVIYHMLTAKGASSGPATTSDYKKAVFDDLSRGPNG